MKSTGTMSTGHIAVILGVLLVVTGFAFGAVALIGLGALVTVTGWATNDADRRAE